MKPKNSIPKSLLVSLPASAIPITEKGQLKEEKTQKICKKIRFYPENELGYHQMLTLYRRAYNLSIEKYKNNEYKDENGLWRDLRKEVRFQCEEEQKNKNSVYNSNVVNEAVLSAKKSFKAILKYNKKIKDNKKRATLKFKSRKNPISSFIIDRMPKGLNPALKTLGKIFLTESIPNEAIGKSCIITYNKGRWFIQVQKQIQTSTEIQGSVECIAIDPGVRTFATCYSQKEVIIAGDQFSKDILLPLVKKVDKLLSKKKKLENIKQEDKQWYKDRYRNLEKKINKLKCKKDDLILDLHHRISYELVSNYDVIFLPTFETKKMFKKQQRNIRRVTVRQMLDLNHYKFKETIKWYAKKYGKHIVDCNESYTSKTLSWNGTIDDKIGGKRIISDGNIIVDRDINGARGIFLKQLTKAT
ncbi:MAG TPA: transposase [Campylobacterales bacterium]|nr:transposase [Campylobacterales bacterium]